MPGHILDGVDPTDLDTGCSERSCTSALGLPDGCTLGGTEVSNNNADAYRA
jgi:hypothetical protein